jgi:hypothetical protein
MAARVVDPELFVSDPTPDPTFKEVSASTPDPTPDPVSDPTPDPVSDPATLSPPQESCPANSHYIREITMIYKVFFRK